MSSDKPTRTPQTSDSGIESLLRSRAKADASSTSQGGSESFSLVSGGRRSPTSTSVHASSGTYTGGGLKGEETSSRSKLVSLVTDPSAAVASYRTKQEVPLKSPRPSIFQLCLVTEEMLDNDDVCGGVINSSSVDSFCFKSSNDCGAASHKTKKHSALVRNTIYIIGNAKTGSSMKAFLPSKYVYTIGPNDPDINVVLLRIADANLSLVGTHTFEDAVGSFISLVALLHDLGQKKSIGKTRKSLGLSDDDSDKHSIKTDPEIVKMQSVLDQASKSPQNDDDSYLEDNASIGFLNLQKEPVNLSEAIFREASEYAAKLETNPDEFAQELTQQVLVLKLTMQNMSDHLDKLSEDAMLRSEFGLSFQRMQSDLEYVKATTAELHQGLVKQRKLIARLRDSNKGGGNLDARAITALIHSETERMVQIRVKEALDARLGPAEAQFSAEVFRDDLNTIEERLVAVEDKSSEGAGSGSFFPSGTAPGVDMTDIKQDIAALEFRVQLLNSRSGSDKLQFGKIELSSLADTQLFVNDHIPTCSYECFVDMIALLDSLRDTQTTEAEYVKSEHDMQKVKLVSVMEASISASFLHVTPLCFCGTSSDADKAVGTVERNLRLVKNREAWSSPCGTSGLCANLELEVSDKVQSLEHNIELTLDGTQGRDLAKRYLDASQKCFGKFVLWTEKFYKEICATSKVEAKDAWYCLLECWMGFFHDLRRVRVDCASVSPAGLAPGSAARKGVVARYIYTMGKAIQIQNAYIEKGFRNHTTIASVINYHLFKHRAPLSMFTSLDKSIKDLHTWKSQIARDVKKLEAKSNTA